MVAAAADMMVVQLQDYINIELDNQRNQLIRVSKLRDAAE